MKFAYRGTNSWFDYKTESGENFGTAHADDCPYVFKIKRIDTNSTTSDRAMVRFMVDLLTSYAHDGYAPFLQNLKPTNFFLENLETGPHSAKILLIYK